MALEKYDYEKLLDDIKLISRSVSIILNENNPDNRKRAGILTEDLITRLYRDIKEMHDVAPRNGRGYGGYLNDEIKEEISGDE